MRTIFYLLLLLTFLGCKKDNSIEGQLTGTWLFKEGKYGTGNGAEQQTIKADPIRPIKMLFRKDGSFSISTEPLFSGVQVQFMGYNRYQLLPDNQVRFYNTSNTEEVIFNFKLDQELILYYPGCREGCFDYFVRSY